LFGPAKGGIGKIRLRIFFQRTKSSGGANTMPPGLREKIKSLGYVILLGSKKYQFSIY